MRHRLQSCEAETFREGRQHDEQGASIECRKARVLNVPSEHNVSSDAKRTRPLLQTLLLRTISYDDEAHTSSELWRQSGIRAEQRPEVLVRLEVADEEDEAASGVVAPRRSDEKRWARRRDDDAITERKTVVDKSFRSRVRRHENS